MFLWGFFRGFRILLDVFASLLFSSYPKEAKQLLNGCLLIPPLSVDKIKHKSDLIHINESILPEPVI